MIPSIRRVGWAAALTVSAALLLTACGGTSTGTAATASPSASATPTPSPTAGAAPVVVAQSVGTMGTILVAASNNHTVYTFDSDTPGVSKCTGGCATTWPPLTVPAGTTPTGGPGVTGQFGTLPRSDRSPPGTHKGLPPYFFHN